MIDLSKRTAVITGGSSGIGRATALLLARSGARVFVGDYAPREENQAAFGELGSPSWPATCHEADVSSLVDLPWWPPTGSTSWCTAAYWSANSR
jgi:NAD(P)-dependent dehydrogenase (short-subunit alcohol dehydrogenase family)